MQPSINVTFFSKRISSKHEVPETMMSRLLKAMVILILMVALPLNVSAFHIPHSRHHHPVYVQYRNEQLGLHFVESDMSTMSHSSPRRSQSNNPADQLVYYMEISLEDGTPLEASISTPISYDEETGMVQTAVRAIVQHPIANLVDNHIVGLSSTLVISLGAVHEFVDCMELTWAHHATSSTEGLALLSLGHFLHYGREAIKQLMELQADDTKYLAKKEV